VKSDVLRKRNRLEEDCNPSPGSKLVLRGKQRSKIPCASPESVIASVTRKTSSQTTIAKNTSSGTSKSQTTEKKEPEIMQASVPGLSDSFVKELLSYTVQPKDTLYQIASRHGMTVGELKSMNNLNGDVIHPGQELKVKK
jgi:LysM repeat protein